MACSSRRPLSLGIMSKACVSDDGIDINDDGSFSDALDPSAKFAGIEYELRVQVAVGNVAFFDVQPHPTDRLVAEEFPRPVNIQEAGIGYVHQPRRWSESISIHRRDPSRKVFQPARRGISPG